MAEEVRETDDGVMECYDTESGEILWKQRLNKRNEKRLEEGKPALVERGGRVSEDSGYHWIRSPEGKAIWVPKGTNPDKMPRTVWPYSEVLAAQICRHVTEGLSLREIGDVQGFPPSHVIYNWARKYESFKKELEHAKADRAEYYHDKALDIAMMTEDKDDVPAAKLKVDTLKWAAQAADPQRFSGKPDNKSDTNKPVQITINTGIKRNRNDDIEIEARELDERKQDESS